MWTVLSRTCVKQQLHHTKVGVRHTVVQGCVPVPVCHVDHVFQQDRGHLGERHQVVRDPRRLSHLAAGDAEPLKLDHVSAGELEGRAESCGYLTNTFDTILASQVHLR